MSGRELDAAGILDPQLRADFEVCRQLNAAHGKTYYLATLLLPPAKRPYVHALYGFARYADEIVDDLDSDATPAQRAEVLLQEHFRKYSPQIPAKDPVTGLPAYRNLERLERLLGTASLHVP